MFGFNEHECLVEKYTHTEFCRDDLRNIGQKICNYERLQSFENTFKIFISRPEHTKMVLIPGPSILMAHCFLKYFYKKV